MVLSDEALAVIAEHNGAAAETTAEEVIETPATEAVESAEVSGEAVTDEQEAGGTEAPASDIDPDEEDDSDEPDYGWVDEVRELAASYDLSEDELKQIGSKENFEKAAILFDKRAAKKEVPVETNTETPAADDELQPFDIEALKAKNYEDDVIASFERQNALIALVKKERESRAALEQQVATIRQSHEQAAAQQHYEVFHDIADTFEESLFGRSAKDGKPVKLTDAQVANRAKLGEALHTVAEGLAATAKAKGGDFQPPSMKVLMQRAKHYAFGDELLKAASSKTLEAASQQSRRRRPAATSKPTNTALRESHRNSQPLTEMEEVSAIVNDPAWRKAYQEITGQN